jgi:hypothetical protein
MNHDAHAHFEWRETPYHPVFASATTLPIAGEAVELATEPDAGKKRRARRRVLPHSSEVHQLALPFLRRAAVVSTLVAGALVTGHAYGFNTAAGTVVARWFH